LLIKLPHLFTPRDYQLEFMRAVFVDGYKHLYWIVHRRAGKSLTALSVLVIAALREPGLYIYLMPQTNQARKVMWQGMGSDSIRFLDRIPPQIIRRINNQEMSVELINGSRIVFVGSNNFDGLIGVNSKMILYDEYSLSNPMARELLAPVLLESGGVEIVFGTPRGHNHGYRLYEMAISNPSWYVRKLTIEDTKREDGSPVITQEMLEEEKKGGKSLAILEQEYYCSFEAGSVGAMFVVEMSRAETEGRICDFEIRAHVPVNVSWDLGLNDQCARTLFIDNNGTIEVLGYIESNNMGLDGYWKELLELKEKLGFRKWGYNIFPHDIRNREIGNQARSRLQVVGDMQIPGIMIAPKTPIPDRMEAVRIFIAQSKFHKTNCLKLIRCLKEAMREYDEINQVFKDKIVHNYCSDGVDSYSYGAVVWRHQFSRPQLNTPKTYQIQT